MRSESTNVQQITKLDTTVDEPQPRKRVIFAFAICCLIWGTTWYGIRACTGPQGYPVFPAAALRFTFCFPILGLLWFARRKKIGAPSWEQLKWIFLAGLFSGASYGLLYLAEQKITGGIAAIVSAISPLVAAMIATSTGVEKSSRMTIIGSIAGLVGVAIIFHDRLHVAPDQAAALGILLLNCLCAQGSNVLAKRQAGKVPPLAMNTVFFFTIAVVLWIGAACSGQLSLPWPPPVVPTIALLYLTMFGTLTAFGLWFYVLKHARLSSAMTISFICPTIALLVDALFERHIVLTSETYFGMGVVLIGVGSTVFSKARKTKEA